MGRIKRGYVREIPDDELKRDYRLFAIACEGSKREREYFQQLEGISRRVIVEYIKDEEYEKDPPSSPQHVLRRALEYAEKVDLNDEDSVWLVMDVDRWGGKALNEVHDECSRRQNWHIVLSNPCFEAWLVSYHSLLGQSADCHWRRLQRGSRRPDSARIRPKAVYRANERSLQECQSRRQIQRLVPRCRQHEDI